MLNQIISLQMSFIGTLLENPRRENIWGVHLVDLQSLSEWKKGIKYLLCAIDLFIKYVLVVLLKDIRGDSRNSLKRRKPNKILVDQGGNFYNILFKRFKVKLLLLRDSLGRWRKNIFNHMTNVSWWYC